MSLFYLFILFFDLEINEGFDENVGIFGKEFVR